MNEYKEMQETMGCYGCVFADSEALGKTACCTSIGKITVDKDGKCEHRKESFDD